MLIKTLPAIITTKKAVHKSVWIFLLCHPPEDCPGLWQMDV